MATGGLAIFTFSYLAAIKQPLTQQLYSRAISCLGLAGCLAMLVSFPWYVIVSGVILFVVGFGVRWW